ncbi:hypothetical protein [Formosa algae]|uniref:Uncharacterized protein n=1 Tax=Formosa algae TaxID=225843 RepID=A0A9X0YKJ9_9FLAO|nr:hypothetical protein [Formosa algae]MBP1838613.1 hypothetical protein [Formosa algae]MDQ0335113.1 hypothetical protein [Formosa algae]OEI80472.1 hypothetical protein AST99_09110 [Formosa algae]
MLYKKALSRLVVFVVLLLSHFAWAHSPDFSNVIISKTENGQVILQINTSLTAFQEEVNYMNGEGAYKTPEEFQNLVIAHFKANFSIVINKTDTLQFKNPKVFLGHETKLVAEVIGLPDQVNSIHLKNELFKEIYNNQSIIIFLMDPFPTEKFTLSRDNNHNLNIELKDGTWTPIVVEEAEDFNFKYVFYVVGILLVLGVIFLIKKRK